MTVTMSTVWDRTTAFVGENLGAVAPIALLGIFVPLSLIGNLMPLIGATGKAGAGIEGTGVAGMLVLALSLASNWGGLAVIALALDPAAGRAVAVRTANRRFVPIVGVNLVAIVVAFVLFLPGMIGFSMAGIPMTQLNGTPPSLTTVNAPIVLFAGLYMLLLMVVLLWVVARFSLINPTLVLERRGLGAFARSFALTRGIALKIVGVIVLYGIVAQVAGFAARTVAGSVLSLLLGNAGPTSLAAILTSIVVAATSTIFSVLALAFLAELYLATRAAQVANFEAA